MGIPKAYKKIRYSSIFNNFMPWYRETGNPLELLRIDNGGYYIFKEFKKYCSKHGIRHEETVLGMPQHISVVEQINRTIMEKV